MRTEHDAAALADRGVRSEGKGPLHVTSFATRIRRAISALVPKAAQVILAVVLACAAAPGLGADVAYAEGPNAIITPAGYDTNAVARGDDTSSLVVGIPFSMNWGGTTFSQIYLNMNGNCTFGNTFTDYTPTTALNALRQDIMAPFWADVDTRNAASGQMTYSDTVNPPLVDGHKAFIVNWINVGYYNTKADKLNSFQLVLVDRSDTGAGNFDFYFNYDKVLWDAGDSSGTRNARVGWGRANRTGFEVPGSGGTGASTLLDTSPAATSLIQNSLNSANQLGRYCWQVRAGLQPNSPPEIVWTNPVLEGNTANGYTGYGTTPPAPTASDPEAGTVTLVASPTTLPAMLPLGVTSLKWTATDRGYPVPTAGNVASTAITQTITVVDTTAPTLPTLTSPTHVSGAWSTVAAARVNWTTSTDVCSGLAGYSYAWSANATAAPDSVVDTATTTYTQSLADGTWYFNIRAKDNAGNWSATQSFGPVKIDTTAPVTTSNAPVPWKTTSPVNITLTPVDPVSGVAYSRYKVDAGATATYTAPFAVSGDGTHTVTFWSGDNASNVEVARTATVRIDTGLPTAPGSVTASALSTVSVEASWTASTDAISGLANYGVFRDGVLITTTNALTFADFGLTPGQTYVYRIVAYDTAGNASVAGGPVSVTMPVATIWMNVSSATVNFGGVTPALPVTVTGATTVSVNGVGAFAYDLTVSAPDFANVSTASVTPFMSIGSLGFVTKGYVTAAQRSFTNFSTNVDSSTGGKFVWKHDYVFDYVMKAPWTTDPGTYTTTIVYTAVAH